MRRNIWRRPLGILLVALMVLGLYVPVAAATVTITNYTTLGVSSADDYVVENGGHLRIEAGVVLSGTVTVKDDGMVENRGTIAGALTVHREGEFHNYEHATVSGPATTLGEVHNSGRFVSVRVEGGFFGNSIGATYGVENITIVGGSVANNAILDTVTLTGGGLYNQDEGRILGDFTVAPGATFSNYGFLGGIVLNDDDGEIAFDVSQHPVVIDGAADTVTIGGRTIPINGRMLVASNTASTASPLTLNGTLQSGGIALGWNSQVRLLGTNAVLNAPLHIAQDAQLFLDTPLTVNGGEEDGVYVGGTLHLQSPLRIASGYIHFSEDSAYGVPSDQSKMLLLGKDTDFFHPVFNSAFFATHLAKCFVYDGPAGGYAYVSLADGDFRLGADGNLIRQSEGSGSSSRSRSSSGGSSPATMVTKRQTEIEQLDDYAFRVDLPLLGFVSAMVDDEPLTQGTDFTLREGSTVLTLTDEFVDGLKTGTHTLRMEFVGAVAKTEFAVDGRSGSDGSAGGDTFPSNANANPGTGR